MAETTTYILAFAALFAAGLAGIVVLPATGRRDTPFRRDWFAEERTDASWIRSPA